MNRLWSAKNTGPLCVLAGILFLVTSAIGIWRIVVIRQQLIESFLNRAYLSAAAYAQAADMWLAEGDDETLLRVSQLMLTGGTRFIMIREPKQVLLELRAQGIPPELDAPGPSDFAETPIRTLLKPSIGWIAEVSIPLKHQMNVARDIRIWMDAESLHISTTATTLKVSAIIVSCWLLLAGGLLLRFRVIKRLANSPSSSSESEGSPWALDPEIKQISIHDQPVRLTPKQYALLSLLISGGSRVFSEEELLASIWPQSPYADSNDIRQCVFKIRKRVASVAAGAEACIVNEMGFGYRFEPSRLPPERPEPHTLISEPIANSPSERSIP